jgi:general secretion pathway protein I
VIYSGSKGGFTLIEVVVALAILGLVLGGAISTVHQYADQRGYLNSKMISSQVAWNALLDKYRHSESWVGKADIGGLKRKGVESQNGQDWNWFLEVKPAVGKDLYRYEAKVQLSGSGRNSSALTLYLIEK